MLLIISNLKLPAVMPLTIAYGTWVGCEGGGGVKSVMASRVIQKSHSTHSKTYILTDIFQSVSYGKEKGSNLYPVSLHVLYCLIHYIEMHKILNYTLQNNTRNTFKFTLPPSHHCSLWFLFLTMTNLYCTIKSVRVITKVILYRQVHGQDFVAAK